jgi:cell division protease FtsH
VPLPDVRGREGILEVHARRTPLADDVSLGIIAKGTPGFSGADLENLVNEAALLGARQDKSKVEMADFEAAKEKVLLGSERRSMVQTEDERRTTAYHEAGHALVAFLSPGADPVHKVTIVPRGRALGLTWQLPDRDRYNETRTFLVSRIDVLMGGRAAEELVFDQVTTGARNDIKQATRIARSLVCEYGMSEKLGPVNWSEKADEVFLGKSISRPSTLSQHTAELIDDEVRALVQRGYDRARTTLLENLDVLHRIADALLERETLDQEDFAELVRGEVTAPVTLEPKAERAPPVGGTPEPSPA